MSEAPEHSLAKLADLAMRNTLMACGRAMSTGDMLEAAKSAEIIGVALDELAKRPEPDYDATLAAAETANVAEREARLAQPAPRCPEAPLNRLGTARVRQLSAQGWSAEDIAKGVRWTRADVVDLLSHPAAPTIPNSPGYWRRLVHLAGHSSWSVRRVAERALSPRDPPAVELHWDGGTVWDDGHWGARVEMPEVPK